MFDHALCTFCCVALYAVCRWRCVARLVSRDGLVRATERVGETKGRGKVRVESHAAVSVFAISLFSTPSPPSPPFLSLLFSPLSSPFSSSFFLPRLLLYSLSPPLLTCNRRKSNTVLPSRHRTHLPPHHDADLGVFHNLCRSASSPPSNPLPSHFPPLSPPSSAAPSPIKPQHPPPPPPPPPKKGEEKHRRI